MSLTLPKGHHFLRLTALTPANCGDTGGSAAIDRPVAVDVWSGLPYLPHSALKGVLAGRLGNVYDGRTLNTRRTGLFGAPDTDDANVGRAGEVVFGDAETLAFPLLLRDGRRAMVAAASTLRRLAHHGILPEATLPHVDDTQGWEGPVALSDLPLISGRLRAVRFGFAAPALAALLGFRGPVIVAAAEAARLCWQAAVEERTLTALGDGRTVRDGSLRTVELIPAGTLFVSLVSNLREDKVDLGPATPLQLGAWESTGSGWFSAEVLGAMPAADPAEDQAPPAVEAAAGHKARHEVMRIVFLALRDLENREEAQRARTRSAIFDLGPRLAQRGLAVTLAFCLAKAGGGEDPGGKDATTLENRFGLERAAYRFILRQLFAAGPQESNAELQERIVAAIRDGDAALPPDFDETRLWLRRYAETLLSEEDDHPSEPRGIEE